ncbi:MAG TPA: hypothetical protein DDZ51_11370 [Planctomycetaceae bacterium]|nr:hypothetical protein [Planctomycetaceae bacterium]
MSGYGFSVGSSGYDDEDRLVNWERPDTNLDQSWNLSAVGNWTCTTENSSTQNRTHGPTYEMLTVWPPLPSEEVGLSGPGEGAVTHDAKGNMTLIPAVLRPTNSGLPPTASRLSWDFENKLIAADTDNDITDDIFYKFDALGRRVGRNDGTANVVYFQDGQQTIADYPSGTAASSPTYTYVYASYIDEPAMRGGSGGLRYYHRNQQYSITAVSDGGGSVERYAYSAYGKVTVADASGTVISSSAIANRYTYTGREWDEGLSLYHYRARMYDAVAGRFVSRDPIGYEGSEWNLYELGASSPLNQLDPSGMISVFGFDPPMDLPPLPPIPWNPCIIAACGSCGAMLAATVYFASEGCSDVSCVITNLEVAYSMMPRYTKATIGLCVTGCGAVGCSLAPPGRIQTGCAIGVALMGGIIAIN